MYRLLRKDQWKQVITSDEAWFYLPEANGIRKVQWLKLSKTRSDAALATSCNQKKGVMVWIGISANGATKPRIVKPGAKIDSEYYISNIL